MTDTTGNTAPRDMEQSRELPDNIKECHKIIKDLRAAIAETQMQLKKTSKKKGKRKI